MIPQRRGLVLSFPARMGELSAVQNGPQGGQDPQVDRIGGVEDPLVHRLSPLAVVGEVHQRRRSQGQRHPPQHVGQTQVALEHLPNTLKAVVVENPCCQYAGLGPPALGQIEQDFLQLDTMTGKIEIVQWSLDDDKEGSATLNNEDLSLGTGCGTFELYPTKNIYQFLLLDKVTGRRWHVQWGFESSKRWIKRIY